MVQHQSGTTIGDLAWDHGLNRETVAKHLKQRGCRCGLQKLTPAEIADVIRCYRSGESCASIGRSLNIDASTIRNYLRRAEVSLRPRRGWPT